MARRFSEGSSYELLEYWLSYYKQDGSIAEDRLAGGNDWALALVNRVGNGPWALHSTLAFGNNGDQTNTNREGDFGGLVLMPMYWLKDEKLKLVGRYLYKKADQSEGLKLSRTMPLLLTGEMRPSISMAGVEMSIRQFTLGSTIISVEKT